MKRISPGTVTVGVIAILFGLAAAYAAREYFRVKELEASPPQPEMAQMVVARINLPQYAKVRADDLFTVERPKSQIPKGAVPSIQRAQFRLVKQTVLAGQPLMESYLYKVGENPRLSDKVPPGHQAMTLPVDANSAVNGMVQPGSIVDIMLTYRTPGKQPGGSATKTIEENVTVLATSANVYPSPEDRPRNVRNITVAVTPLQAKRLTLAQKEGSLSVTLHSTQAIEAPALAAGDSGEAVTAADLLGLPPIADPEVKTAEIYRGGSVQQVKFRTSQIREAVEATVAAERRAATRAVPVSSEHSEPTTAVPPALYHQPTLANPAGILGGGSTGRMIEVTVEADQLPLPADTTH